MDLFFGDMLDGSDNPVWAPMGGDGFDITSFGQSIGLGLSSASSVQSVGTQVAVFAQTPSASVSSIEFSGSGSSIALALDSSVAVDGGQSGGDGYSIALGFSDSQTEVEHVSIADSSGIALSESITVVPQGTSLEVQQFIDAMLAGQSTLKSELIAELQALMPPEISAYMDAQLVSGSLTRKDVEYVQASAVLGTHKDGKVLPGTLFPVAPGTVLRYTDPADPTKTVLEYTIDQNGNRVPLAFIRQDGTRVEINDNPVSL